VPADSPRLVLVSGLSGAGKTVALHTLEDLGYYCIDNLPAGLLPEIAGRLVEVVGPASDHIAVGIDARNPADALEDVPGLMAAVQASGMACEIVFLDAEDLVLKKRFSETRRRHPLTESDVPLAEAISRERKLLGGFARHADVHIDTSYSNIHQLRDLIRKRVDRRPAESLSLMFQSFGYKCGVPPDADIVFDARCLPNPYWDADLRMLNGLDEKVADYLHQSPAADELFEGIRDFLLKWVPQYEDGSRAYMTVAIGCTGGQHRSVWLAERLYRHFSGIRDNVLVRHRELS